MLRNKAAAMVRRKLVRAISAGIGYLHALSRCSAFARSRRLGLALAALIAADDTDQAMLA